MNAVLGYAQILERDETIPPPRQSSIKVIRRSAEHLSGLIDGLLDISKIEAGRLQVYSNEINIQDFLDQIVEMFRPQAQAKGLDFVHDRSPALPQFVRTDEKRLRQILVNLLSNAIKFTDEGSITFDVGYRSQVATFTVADTGRGITEKDLPRIYEPFQRGEAESVRPMPGSRARPHHHPASDQHARRRDFSLEREGRGFDIPRAADAVGRHARCRPAARKAHRRL